MPRNFQSILANAPVSVDGHVLVSAGALEAILADERRAGYLEGLRDSDRVFTEALRAVYAEGCRDAMRVAGNTSPRSA
jgi:hypothetical protein